MPRRHTGRSPPFAMPARFSESAPWMRTTAPRDLDKALWDIWGANGEGGARGLRRMEGKIEQPTRDAHMIGVSVGYKL